jgi:methionyl-tRNA synthetase
MSNVIPFPTPARQSISMSAKLAKEFLNAWTLRDKHLDLYHKTHDPYHIKMADKYWDVQYNLGNKVDALGGAL